MPSLKHIRSKRYTKHHRRHKRHKRRKTLKKIKYKRHTRNKRNRRKKKLVMKGGGGWLTPTHLGRRHWGYQLNNGRLIEISTQIYEIMKDIMQRQPGNSDFNITTINADEAVLNLYSEARGVFAGQAQKKAEEDEVAMIDDEDDNDDDDEEDEGKEYDPPINLGQEHYQTILETLQTRHHTREEGAKLIIKRTIGAVKINKVLDTVNNPTIQANLLVIICNNSDAAQELNKGADEHMRHSHASYLQKTGQKTEDMFVPNEKEFSDELSIEYVSIYDEGIETDNLALNWEGNDDERNEINISKNNIGIVLQFDLFLGNTPLSEYTGTYYCVPTGKFGFTLETLNDLGENFRDSDVACEGCATGDDTVIELFQGCTISTTLFDNCVPIPNVMLERYDDASPHLEGEKVGDTALQEMRMNQQRTLDQEHERVEAGQNAILIYFHLL